MPTSSRRSSIIPGTQLWMLLHALSLAGVLSGAEQCVAQSVPSSETGRNADQNVSATRLDLKGSAVALLLGQRQASTVPGSDGSLQIQIGDITGGTVFVTLKGTGATTILDRTPMAEGEEVEFRVGDRTYTLRLNALTNRLFGNDTAEFLLARADDARRSAEGDALEEGEGNARKFWSSLEQGATTIAVEQRRSKPIPGSGGSMIIELGDVSDGMAFVVLKTNGGNQIVDQTPMSEGEVVEFEIADKNFALKLLSLRTSLLGEDVVKFTVARAGDEATNASRTEEEQADQRSGRRRVKVGETIETAVSGRVKVIGLQNGSVVMRFEDGPHDQEFSLRPGEWFWLSHREIMKVHSASEKTQSISFRLYYPAPIPPPF